MNAEDDLDMTPGTSKSMKAGTSKSAKARENKPHVGSADTVFPLSRVRTIMKSSQDTGQITNDVLFVMTRCTELFVQYLAKEAYELMKKSDSAMVKYEHLSQLVNEKTNLEFLLQIIPAKITVKEFKDILRGGGATESEESEDGSDKSE